jgi:hypothetical protein
MVRRYIKQIRNAYVGKTRLSELEFLLILRGCCWLLTAGETVSYIHDYAVQKKIEHLHVSRVTVNKYFQLINARVSQFVESGNFMGSSYPFGDHDLGDIEKRNQHIEKLMGLFHEVLSDQIDYQEFKRIFALWREKKVYPHFEDYYWYLKLLWQAMKGISRSELRGQYNRAAFLCYFIDRNLDNTPQQVSRLVYEYLVAEFEKNPL